MNTRRPPEPDPRRRPGQGGAARPGGARGTGSGSGAQRPRSASSGSGRAPAGRVPASGARAGARPAASRSTAGRPAANRTGAQRRPAAPQPEVRRWLPAIAAVGVLGVVVFAGFSGKDDAATSAETVGSNPGAIDDSLLTVPATTLAPVVIGSDPTIVKTQLSQTLSKGMWGDEVKALQQRLHDLGFDPGPVDGQFGSGTEQALWAFEGLYSGLKYDQQTGKLTNDMWQAMQDPLVFQPRRQGGVGNTHMEIYLDLQVGIVFTDDKAVLITHISSGELDENGEPKLWCELTTYNTNEYGEPLDEPITRDECGYSKTPGGVFKFYRRYEGNRVGPLGGMWNPVYFNYGIAVHGAKNVPNKPASHGCIRIPMHIADYFPSLVANGNRVYVWDGKLEPEQQSKNSMLPSFNFPNPDSTTTSSTTSTTSTTTTVKPTTTTVKATTTTTKPTTTTTSAPPTTSTTVPTETT